MLSWVRRGRIDADSWLGEEIPLGEETERYRVTIAKQDGSVLRIAETFEPHWTYTLTQQLEDFPVRPATIEVSVHQISTAVGEGLPGRKLFTLG